MIITEIKNILVENGVRKGDIICIFSDVANFGIPQSIKQKVLMEGINYLLDSYIDTFKSVVKREGLILMPTFTYSSCKGQEYDVEETESTVGTLTEFFRKKKNVKRSLHPIFSFAAWGKRAAGFLKLDDFDCFGENSVFGKLYKTNAKYILFGVDMQQSATFVYFSEQKYKVNYRYFKEFIGQIKFRNNRYTKKIRYFVRKLDFEYEDYWYDLEKFAKQKGIMKKGEYNGQNISIINSKEVDAFIFKNLKNNKSFLIRREKNGKVT